MNWLRRLFPRRPTKPDAITPGMVRIRGRGRPYLTGYDCEIEVQQRDGCWLKLRGLTAVDIQLRPDQIALAEITVELVCIDVMVAGERVILTGDAPVGQ